MDGGVEGGLMDIAQIELMGVVLNLYVALLGDVPVVAAGAFPIADVKAVVELRNEV